MNAILALNLANALLAGFESLLPVLQSLKLSGQITDEQQAELLARYQSLKNQADGQFTGKEWEV